MKLAKYTYNTSCVSCKQFHFCGGWLSWLVRFFLNKQGDSGISHGLQIIGQPVSAVRRWTSKRQHLP
jgi:hypothetical protein